MYVDNSLHYSSLQLVISHQFFLTVLLAPNGSLTSLIMWVFPLFPVVKELVSGSVMCRIVDFLSFSFLDSLAERNVLTCLCNGLNIQPTVVKHLMPHL